jgi:phage terminase large subunit-like protein
MLKENSAAEADALQTLRACRGASEPRGAFGLRVLEHRFRIAGRNRRAITLPSLGKKAPLKRTHSKRFAPAEAHPNHADAFGLRVLQHRYCGTRFIGIPSDTGIAHFRESGLARAKPA